MPCVWLLFHALMLRWHFDLAQDYMRNGAYNQAISRVSLLVLSIFMQGSFHALCIVVILCPHAQVAL